MHPPPFKVILLAAGLGTRLGALGGGLPKALVEVQGRTLLAHVLDFVTALEPAGIVIVGGFEYPRMQAAVAALGRTDVQLVQNTRFRAGNLYSVEAALPRVDGAFLLTNVDHIFPAAIAPRVRAAMGDAVTAFCQFERTLEDDEMKVKLDAQRNIVRIAKTLTDFDGGYIGMTHVPAQARAAYAAGVAAAHAVNGEAAVAENVLQALADSGTAVQPASLDGIQWAEVDTPADHARAAAWLSAAHPRP